MTAKSEVHIVNIQTVKFSLVNVREYTNEYMKINLNWKFYHKDSNCQNEFGRFIFTKNSNDKLDFLVFSWTKGRISNN